MYRFRSIKNLLDRGELEKSEIYFASTIDQNDPMEGYIDFIWNGDIFLWENLLKNYITILEEKLTSYLLDLNRTELFEICIPTSQNRHKHRPLNLLKIIENNFFKNPITCKLLEFLSTQNNRIRRDELISYFRLFHPIVCKAIIDVEFPEESILKESLGFDRLVERFNLEEITKSLEYEKNNLLNHHNRKYMYSMINQIYEYQNNFHSINNHKYNKELVFLKLDFPSQYIDALEKYSTPDFNISCFMNKCDSPSLWGYYGESHKGVCLKFKPKKIDDRLFLSVNHHQERNVKISDFMDMELHKINYEIGLKEIDFFKFSFKLLTPELSSEIWYTNDKGKKHEYLEEYQNDKDLWSERFKQLLKEISTRKDPDWSNEDEYRLVINDYWNSNVNSDRLHRYDFNQLDGIIFGIKTLKEDKLKMIEVIKKKCLADNRKEFSFYQAYYNYNTNKISYLELPILDMEKEVLHKLNTK
ncbi:MAG: DUF2971 domain-containing protein [Spirochaetaceae bacterium]